MSLVAAIHLGDAIGIIGDTRITARYNDGTIERKDDALKVYRFSPFGFGVAVAGCVQSSVQLISELLQGSSWRSDAGLFSDVVDLSWMVSNIEKAYKNALLKRFINQNHSRFKCLFIAEDSVSLRLPHGVNPSKDGWQKSGITDASIATSAQFWARFGESPHRLVFSIDFPNLQVEVARPGDVLLAGTGAKAEDLLRSKHTILNVMTPMTFGDRLAAVGADLGRAAEVSEDISFNGIYLGFGISHGFLEVIYHGFQEWPKDSVPKQYYIWNPIGDELIFEGSYSAGLDIENENVGWIYDPFEKQKLRVKSYFDPEMIIPIKQQTFHSLEV